MDLEGGQENKHPQGGIGVLRDVLQSMVEPGLAELRSLIDQVYSERKSITLANVERRLKDGDARSLDIHLMPLSANDTLQLETMNEEMQSTNEELQTINHELRQRTDELNSSNIFLHWVFASLRGGVFVVDPKPCAGKSPAS